MVIRGKASKCGKTSRAPVAPTTRGVPLSSSSGPSPPRVVIFPYLPKRSTIAPHCSFGQHDASRAIQPVFLPTGRQSTSAPPVASRSLPSSVSGAPPPVGRACVRRVHACLCHGCARVRACPCNNNKKRATL